MADSTVPTGKREDAARDPDRKTPGSAGSTSGKTQRRRVPGLDAAVGKATSGAKGVAGGARRASSTAGRTVAAAGRNAATRTGRAAGKTGRTAGSGVVATGRAAEKTGRTAGAGVAGAGQTVASGTGAVAEKGTGTVRGVVGTAVRTVGPVLRTGLGTSLGFLVSKALILLHLIKRLAMMALEAIERLGQRLRERAAARRAQSAEQDEDAGGREEAGREP
jgi:hypothetical protein